MFKIYLSIIKYILGCGRIGVKFVSGEGYLIECCGISFVVSCSFIYLIGCCFV